MSSAPTVFSMADMELTADPCPPPDVERMSVSMDIQDEQGSELDDAISSIFGVEHTHIIVHTLAQYCHADIHDMHALPVMHDTLTLEIPTANPSRLPIGPVPLPFLEGVYAYVVGHSTTAATIHLSTTPRHDGTTLLEDVTSGDEALYLTALKSDIVDMVRAEGGAAFEAVLIESGYLDEVKLCAVTENAHGGTDIRIFTNVLNFLQNSIQQLQAAAVADPEYAEHVLDEWASLLEVRSTKTIRHSTEVGSNAAEFARRMYVREGYLPAAIARKQRTLAIQGLGHDVGKVRQLLEPGYRQLQQLLCEQGHAGHAKFLKYFTDDGTALMQAIFEDELDFSDITSGDPRDIPKIIISQHDQLGYSARLQKAFRRRFEGSLPAVALMRLQQSDRLQNFFDGQLEAEFRPEVLGDVLSAIPGIDPAMLCRVPLGGFLRARTVPELRVVLTHACNTAQDRATIAAVTNADLADLLGHLTTHHAHFATLVHDFVGSVSDVALPLADADQVVDQFLRLDDVRMQYFTASRDHHLDVDQQYVRIGSERVLDRDMGIITWTDMRHAQMYRKISSGRSGPMVSRRASLEEALLVEGIQLQPSIITELKQQAFEEGWYARDTALVLAVPQRLLHFLAPELQADAARTRARIERVVDHLGDLLPGLTLVGPELRGLMKDRLSCLFFHGLTQQQQGKYSFGLTIAAPLTNTANTHAALVGGSGPDGVVTDYLCKEAPRDDVLDFRNLSVRPDLSMLRATTRELQRYHLLGSDRDAVDIIAGATNGIEAVRQGFERMLEGAPDEHDHCYVPASVAERRHEGITGLRALIKGNFQKPLMAAA